MDNGWTPERKARQAELIRIWKPWLRSTGPRTDEGKARAARNAFKNGSYRQIRRLSKTLNEVMNRQRSALSG